MKPWWKLLCGAALSAALALTGFAQSQSPINVTIIGIGVNGVPTAPANERSGPAGTPIEIEAQGLGTSMITSFTYSAYVNGVHIGTSQTAINPPSTFIVEWTPPAPGAYFITVKIDDGTSTATSLPVRYFATGTTVNSPVDGTLVPAGSSVVLKADATGAQGFVKQVQFYANGVAIGAADTTYPYSLIYTPQGAGGTSYSITAVATDNNGAMLSTSPAITLTTVTPIPAPPTSVISTPEDGAVIAVPSATSPLAVVVDANSSSGFVSKVELYIDGVLSDTKTTYPYKFTWTPQVVGTYHLVALTYDDKNNVVASSAGVGGGATPTPTTVTIAAPPTVTISAPTANSTLTSGTPVQVSATATDPGGHAITSVQFFVDSEFVGVVSTPSAGSTYTITTTLSQKTSSDGTPIPSSITALATNNVGLATISSAITVNVTAGGGSGGGTVIGNAPTVSVTAPVAATPLAVNVPHTLAANATDTDGNIVSVQFFVNGTSVGTVNTYPYSLSWTPVSLGAYAITAAATDNDGNSVTSSTVSVSVVDPSASAPTVVVTSPANLASIAVNAPQTLIASATDDVAISGVQFYVNGQPQGLPITAFPYATSWLPASPGTYAIKAVASDNVGNQTTSATNVITVTATPPASAVVVITAPSSVPTIFVNSAHTVSADAAVANGNIVSVQFFANGAPIGNVNNYPYAVSWTPVTPGTYALTAVAKDNHGLQTTSPDQVVTVVAGSAPSVTLVAPADGASVALGGTQNITASANGGSASVASVQFFLNGNLLGVATSAPYTIQWTPLTLGTYALTAAVTDTNGHTVTSAPISATVVVPKPSLAFTPPTSVTVNTLQTLVATATPVAGTSVTQVEFFINGASVGVDTLAPYTMPWTPAATGTYTLSAIATDSLGGQSALVSVPVSVVALPRIDVVSPNGGATYVLGTPTALVANVTVGSGLVAGVSFFVNDVNVTQGDELLAPVALQGSGSPFFSQNWLPAAAGNYSVVAKVRDTNGNTATSTPVAITITSGVAPTVAMATPANGAILSINVPVMLLANANSTTGSISRVRFFANNMTVGDAVTEYPYFVSFTPPSPGVYVLTAQATDNLGNITTSAPHIVTATPAATSIAITAPTNGATALVNKTHDITATVTAGSVPVSNVEFFVDGVSIGVATQMPYTVSWTPTLAGMHIVKAVATDLVGAKTSSLAVSLVTPLSVAITSPASLGTVAGGAVTQVTVTATSTNGYPVNVQLFADDKYVGETTIMTAGGSGTITFTPVQKKIMDANGNLVLVPTPLRAVASDVSGVTATSAEIQVNVTEGGSGTGSTVVGQPPVAALITPTASTTLPVAAPVTLGATASDPDGNITSVIFRVNGQVYATLNAYPYYTLWTPTNLGTYAIDVKVTDNDGNTTISAPVTVSVIDPGPGLPTVAITSPANNAVVTAGTITNVTASATDDISVARVQFYVNGQPLGEAITASPYNVSWTPSTPGTYTLVARATDNIGNQATSSPVTVTVGTNAAPVVALTTPTSGSSAVSGMPVNLTATANDADGTVVLVRFLANNIEVGRATTAPFTVAWTPGSAGAYTLVAEATDNSSNVALSASASLTVVANQAPTVRVTAPSDGSTLAQGTATTITAQAADADGSVTSVKFYVNGALLATGAAAPYSTPWTPSSAGLYRLNAVATDNAGITTTSADVNIMVVSPGSTAPDVVYKGIYGSAEQGTFMMINIGGKHAALIGQSSSGPAKTYFLPAVTLNSTGGFDAMLGGKAFAGQATEGAATATLGGNAGLVFIAPTVPAAGSAVASGYYTGNLTGAPASQVAAIVAPDGSIEVYVANGTFTDAGAGTVDGTGAFRVTTAAGNTLSGTADPATGFLTGTLTGSSGGAFTGAIASGSSLSDGALLNVSTRGLASAGDKVLIAGFVVEGTTPKRMLVRAAGPSLGLAGQVANPSVALFNQAGAAVASNDDWATPVGVGAATQGDIAAAANLVGAFPFTTAFDSAVLTTLAPGVYTAQVSSGSGTAGIALVEVYDVDTPASFSAKKIVNLSTRGQVGAGGDEGLIAGFVISGHAPKKVLIRGAGPWLAQFGVAGVLANPKISLYRTNPPAAPTLVRENDDWEVGNDSALIVDATAKARAAPFDAGSKDAAILLRLPPGVYTANLTGVAGATGIALIEVYEVP
ncbi:hypothetical protein K0B96_02825 [Horticoccus luteus]|uniref:PKD/Chitinase domain-containing protein n=1 Tax=Horticoccus luteus TaxID=2862869 RepID=A0A8F9XKC7_9BACT|nr:Ig-like domain-containing protein [Horticoccus luteus]QYM79568.1 hypothetical protein K0B96_02825 [Horticoccus luteus]